jgi:hypothetical protein
MTNPSIRRLSTLGRSFRWLTAVLALNLVPLPLAADEAVVLGWIEIARLYPGDLRVHAKLDSGAKRSSLNAQGLEFLERGGETWARFSLTGRDGKSRVFERPIIDTTHVRRAGVPRQRRPVVSLGVCLGETYAEAEVTLTDRSEMSFQLLIGREFMAGRILIDPAKSYTVEPNCSEVKAP